MNSWWRSSARMLSLAEIKHIFFLHLFNYKVCLTRSNPEAGNIYDNVTFCLISVNVQ